MIRFLIATTLAAIVVFAWGSLSWLALGLHDDTVGLVQNDEALIETIQSNVTRKGGIFLPQMPTDVKPDSPEMQQWMQKHKKGPVITMFIRSEGAEPMGPPTLGMGFLIDWVSALIAATLLSIATRSGLGFFARAFFVSLLGLFAAIFVHFSYMNWMFMPLDWTLAMAADVVIAWALAGLVLATFIRPRTVA